MHLHGPLLCSSIGRGRVLRRHIGSMAFGSLIVALVQLVRAIMAYIDSQTKELQANNVLAKVLMKVVQCLLWCFEQVRHSCRH